MNSFLDKTGLTYLWGKITTALGLKADKIQEVNHGTSDTTFTLTPNVMHIWGTVSSLNLSLPTDTNSVLDEYLFTFTCSTGGTTLTLPASIVWIQDPEFEEGKTYQISIVNNLAGYLTNGMVAGSSGTESDPIFKASPAYGIATTDISNWNGKQAALVSGTNIKTINNQSLLGSGNISISGGSGGDENVIETVKVNGTALTPDANKAVDVPVPTESTVSGWGFTKNTGTYSKPSTGIPKTDLASAVQTSLGKADTALQSYTETDPVFAASAAHGITSSDITNWNNKTSNVGTITGITMNGSSKGTSGVVDLGTVITAHQDISGKANINDLATVATSGSYNDLSNKPIIPAGSDWTTFHFSASSSSAKPWYNISKPTSNHTVFAYDVIITRYSTMTLAYYRIYIYRHTSSSMSASINNIGIHRIQSGNTSRLALAVDSSFNFYIQPDITNDGNISIRCINDDNGSINTTSVGTATFGTASGFTAAKMLTTSSYFRYDSTNPTDTTYDGEAAINTNAINGLPSVTSSDNGNILQVVSGEWQQVTPTTIYSGSSAPSSSLGKNGDIYIQTS